MATVILTCPACAHPNESHDDFGCCKWVKAPGGMKMCPCSIPKSEAKWRDESS
jgi:hypothetical protein